MDHHLVQRKLAGLQAAVFAGLAVSVFPALRGAAGDAVSGAEGRLPDLPAIELVLHRRPMAREPPPSIWGTLRNAVCGIRRGRLITGWLGQRHLAVGQGLCAAGNAGEFFDPVFSSGVKFNSIF